MHAFVARQPIFDRNNKVVGYELLYRRELEAEGSDAPDAQQMTPHVIVDAFLGIGLDELTGGRPAFINATRDMLVDGAFEVLEPREIIVEILEDIQPDDEVVEACRALADQGYRLALDDFVYHRGMDPLLELAEIVKIDILAQPLSELPRLVDRLRPFGVRLLAEKVEDDQAFERCMELGFEFFQGYRFSRPETLSKRDLAVAQMRIARLMNLVHDLDAPDREIEDAFRSDVGLSYKLLRMANAAALGSRGITSLGHALRLLGRDALYRWLGLLLVSSGHQGGMKEEMARSALIRARFCELVGAASAPPLASGALFLVGLFSRLDQILGVAMDTIVDHLRLAPAVGDALLAGEGPLAPPLQLVTAYEEARWEDVLARCERLGVAPRKLPDLYLQALHWSRKRTGLDSV